MREPAPAAPAASGATSSSGSTLRRRAHEEAMDNYNIDSALSLSSPFLRNRSVRRRVEYDHMAQPSTAQPLRMDPPSAAVSHRSRPPIELQSMLVTVHMPVTFEFVVYLPNQTSVEVGVPAEACNKLTVQGFVKLVKMELDRRGNVSNVKQREIVWGDHVEIKDFQGIPIRDGELNRSPESKSGRVLLLYDMHADTVHAHPGFWNVTPEPHMLEVLPQDYTLFSALADELDNSLQAVYQLQPQKHRLICVDLNHKDGKISIYDTGRGMDATPDNCIAKWGTLGSSTSRHVVTQAIGGDPPYLKPNFGMYGFGGISAGFHLGGYGMFSFASASDVGHKPYVLTRRITVSSKTETSQRVAILHLGRKSLTENVKSGSVWKTGGEFRAPTEEELRLSPHRSFTKVEISDLNRKVSTWKVEDVQRKLKDYYFPYIQNDEGDGETITTRPVEILVNGSDLAGVLGGEVTTSNLNSGRGDPFLIILKFTKVRDMMGLSELAGNRGDEANARITCHYFPVNKGREAIDDIIDQLKFEDSNFTENFESFSRRSIRRLGRLLPDARGGRLPFMEPKRIFRMNEVNRHCYKRAKAFIDVDAGFIPTQSKMDLIPKDPFTEALLNLGLGLQTVDTARVTLRKPVSVALSIKRWKGEPGCQGWVTIKPEHLHAEYTAWITQQHESFDVGAVFNDNSLVIVTQNHNMRELNITKEVFRVVYAFKCQGIDWKVGNGQPPKHLKLLKGLPGLNNNDSSLFVTVECFISEGFPDDPGDTKIICRPIDIPEDRGSREGLGDAEQLPSFVLGESRVFPVEILYSDKVEELNEAAWQKRLDVIHNKSPGFVELLNEPEISELGGLNSLLQYTNLKAGAALPNEVIAVVRPSSCKRYTSGRSGDTPRLEKKRITSESMEMTLVVRVITEIDSVETERVYQATTTACIRNNLKGLYCFNTTGTILESMTRTTGKYEFTFTLVGEKYQAVDDYKICINVLPSSKIGHWNICSHPGLCSAHHPNQSPEVMNVRLGKVLPGSLFLSRVDEFNNPMEFTEVPADIKGEFLSMEGEPLTVSAIIDQDHMRILEDDQFSVEIPSIEVEGGNLEPLKPTMQAELRMSVEDSVVARFHIRVLPGRIASARLKENEAPENHLKPDQIVDRIVFEGLDKYENSVSSGELVKVRLDGFQFQDKIGHVRPIDENGSLDLGMRLKVKAGYGQRASVELRSTDDLFLCMTTFDIINRKLRASNEPDHAVVDSQLTGIVIETVDEDEQLDETMTGITHTLTLDWNPDITVPLNQGRGTLPPIRMPSIPQMWTGCVAHSQYPELQTSFMVRVEENPERDGGEIPAPTDPPNIPAEPRILLPPTRPLEVPRHDEIELFVRPETPSSCPVAFTKNMDSTIREQEKKMKACEKQYNKLMAVQKDHEHLMKRLQDELDALGKTAKSEPSTSGAPKAQPADPPAEAIFDPFTLTPKQVERTVSELGHPPGTHAASLLLQAQWDGNSEITDADDVIGIVALLGAVQGDLLNRALVEFLGFDNMLAIVCTSRRAAECMGIPPLNGARNKKKGLSGFARSRNLRISGRYQVIDLSDKSSFFTGSNGSRAVNENHPQRLLNIAPDIKPGSERVKGSLGYAVNMVHLNEEQLSIRVAGHGLRESLFFMLFGYLEVFDTTINMIRAKSAIRTTAVSLDGGLIRAPNRFELGSREDPVVRFPAVQQNETSMKQKTCAAGTPLQMITPSPVLHSMTIAAKKKSLKQSIETAKQKYNQGGTEEQLLLVMEKLNLCNERLADVKQKITVATLKGTNPVSPESRRPGSKY